MGSRGFKGRQRFLGRGETVSAWKELCRARKMPTLSAPSIPERPEGIKRYYTERDTWKVVSSG
jgi:hypothetical protein